MYSCAFTIVFVILSSEVDDVLLRLLVSVLLALRDRASLRLECLSITTSLGNNIQSSIGGDGTGWWMTTSFVDLHFSDLSICFNEVCWLRVDMLAELVDDGTIGWQRGVASTINRKVGCY